jgi:hypothetical protein
MAPAPASKETKLGRRFDRRRIVLGLNPNMQIYTANGWPMNPQKGLNERKSYGNGIKSGSA